MSQERRPSYLFLLKSPSPDARRDLAGRLRDLGARVVAEYGDIAVEARATEDQAAAAREGAMVAAALRGSMSKENVKRLGSEAKAVIDLWNRRHSQGYRRMRADHPKRGESWASEGKEPPLPHSAIDAAEFIDLVKRTERDHDVRLLPDEAYRDEPGQGPRDDGQGSGPGRVDRPPEVPDEEPLTEEEFRSFERTLARRYDNETLAYHLSRLGVRLGRKYHALLLDLPQWLIDLIWRLLHPETGCWEMTGEMSVGLVFVESSQAGGPTFSTAERNDICNEIIDGLNWLASEHPGGQLTWVYDLQFVRINVADGTSSSQEDYWRNPAMGQVSYDGNTYAQTWAAVADYREDMRVRNHSDHAFVIFVTPYGNSWHAYASGGRVTLARRNNWGGWGRGTLDTITAHETSHLFGSADEYTGSGTPCSSCTTTHGCDGIRNGNCGACARTREACVMDGNSRRLCSWTRGHIGWTHLFVELETGDLAFAGTDDDVWLETGIHSFVLDNAGVDDRERDNIQGYALWAPWLRRDQIGLIRIRKSPDGWFGGWRLERVRVWFNGELICDQTPNVWLEDDHLTWTGCVFDRDYVTRLRVKITTADVSYAGTDDDVSVQLAGSSFNLDNAWHDDFERGNTDTFDLTPYPGMRRSAMTSVGIRKSPDGVFGGWKLKGVEVQVNGATIYNNQSINQWLEDDHRTWLSPI